MKQPFYIAISLALIAVSLFSLSLSCRSSQEKSEPPHSNWVLVDCSECDGTGKVFYGPDHIFVAELGYESKEYDCPICNGGRNEIWQETR